jgi:hypothetical protein
MGWESVGDHVSIVVIVLARDQGTDCKWEDAGCFTPDKPCTDLCVSTCICPETREDEIGFYVCYKRF